jgi:hypothetical protein
MKCIKNYMYVMAVSCCLFCSVDLMHKTIITCWMTVSFMLTPTNKYMQNDI